MRAVLLKGSAYGKPCSLREILARRQYHIFSGKGTQPVQTKRKFAFEPLFTENNTFQKFLQTHLQMHETPAIFLNFVHNDGTTYDGTTY